MNIAGLTSGDGRSLLHLAATRPGDAEVAVVLADDPDAAALDRAADLGIPTEVVAPGDEEPRGDHQRRVVEALEPYAPELVCLDGYGRVLTPPFFEAVATTLAVQPSLLPAFPRGDAAAAALEAGVRTTGATVHVVSGEEGRGPVVTQEPVPVFADDTPEALAERVVTRGAFRAYPRAVRLFAEDRVAVDRAAGTVAVEGDDGGPPPARYLEGADRVAELRYGENPHQDAAVYEDHTGTAASVVGAPQLNPGAKALSYNNYNDADAALGLVREFEAPAAAVIKHTNPAGCAVADDLATAYEDALATDEKSAFGGVVALNRECDRATAAAITDSFKEVVVAPGYDDDALEVLREAENLRVLEVGALDGAPGDTTEKHLVGGRLVQDRDDGRLARGDLEVVTEREPTDAQLETMLFAWQTAKHVKSNAIVFADGTETVGVGAGQVSRVDAVELAAKKADRDAEGKSADGAVMASDAFFPFPDAVEIAAEAGVAAVVQPGGSVRDDEVIAACDDRGLAMAFTGRRAFRHD